MASAVSYEYLKAIQGVPGGIPVLDDDGKIPESQLPSDAVSPFKGQFALIADLDELDDPVLADYAFVDETSSFWYWNPALTVPAWVNQEIIEEDYIALDPAEQSMVPYLVIPPLYIPPNPPPEPDPEP